MKPVIVLSDDSGGAKYSIFILTENSKVMVDLPKWDLTGQNVRMQFPLLKTGQKHNWKLKLGLNELIQRLNNDC